jgi:hypothetical protein
MRKSLFFMLLATAATPALAAGPNDWGGGGRHGGARAERSDNGRSSNSQRSQRAMRSEPAEQNQEKSVERGDRGPRTEHTQQIVQSSDQSPGQTSSGNSGHHNQSGGQSGNNVQSPPVTVRDSSGGVTNWRSRERYSRGTSSPTIPTDTQQVRSHHNGGDRSGTHWGDRTRDGQATATNTRTWRNGNRDDHTRRWTSNWRNDHRYNWRNHRNRYSSNYHLGRYYDPFGYGYRRFSIGFNLYPSYYGSNYWLNDPWQYRLPPAYGPYRWVRYYNDALLVDIYSGEVVDVIYGFFW